MIAWMIPASETVLSVRQQLDIARQENARKAQQLTAMRAECAALRGIIERDQERRRLEWDDDYAS